MITTIVLSGGGTIGLHYLGALTCLNEQGFWRQEDIRRIYGTSVGSILGACLCLGYDWPTLNKYILERPWHEAFTVSGKQVFEVYKTKGLFDKRLAEIVFKPLLEAKDLDLNITLQQLFDFCHIDLYLYTFELNSFRTVELSHHSHPELSLMQAVTMSSAVPVLFQPTCFSDSSFCGSGCFIDGGVMANYPLSFVDPSVPKEEILGFHLRERGETPPRASNVTNESTILDFVVAFSMNAMQFITNTMRYDEIPHEVVCKSEENPLALDVIQACIKKADKRKQLFDQGYQAGQRFLSKKTQLQLQDSV